MDPTKHQSGDESLTHANALIEAVHNKDAEGVIDAIRELTEKASAE